MPCRALDAFGLNLTGGMGHVTQPVLMPCRALDAFGPTYDIRVLEYGGSLNALSGIGCIRTIRAQVLNGRMDLGLNALSGIGCIRTETFSRPPRSTMESLNALSGIGCIRTTTTTAFHQLLSLKS